MRFLAGVALYGLGIGVLVRGVGSHPLELADVAVAIFAVDLVMTAYTGFCPIYYVLGWDLSRGRSRGQRQH